MVVASLPGLSFSFRKGRGPEKACANFVLGCNYSHFAETDIYAYGNIYIYTVCERPMDVLSRQQHCTCGLTLNKPWLPHVKLAMMEAPIQHAAVILGVKELCLEQKMVFTLMYERHAGLKQCHKKVVALINIHECRYVNIVVCHATTSDVLPLHN